MDRRAWIIAAVALLIAAAAAFGYSLTRYNEPATSTKTAVAEQKERLRDACASAATYDRLKLVLFEEAIRIRNADPVNLETLAASSVVRMEEPMVKSRDEGLNVTVCTGRFILELPPGAERGFGGERRLAAEIEYAAQPAVDGSGLVYQMSGAEPIIYKLAAFDLRGENMARATPPPAAEGVGPADAEGAPPASAAPMPAPAARERPTQAPAARVEEKREPRSDPTRPSFNCRSARTRGEQAVCGSASLASLDRAMSSLFYSAMSDADRRTRRALLATRDRFLAYRDKCGSEACIAEAYRGRMEEIRDIAADAE